MQVSFIILNYRSRKYLKKCILSIIKKVRDLKFEIIVVNNDERKIKTFLSRETYFNKIKIIEINKNVGFARANNEGANKSTGEIICFINPDARIISENINVLIKEFDADNRIGVIGPKILKGKKIQPWSVGVDMNIFEILKSKLGFPRSRRMWLCKRKIGVDWVSGVSLFVKRSLFSAVSGFDENFFIYYEDVDLCKRIKKLDKKIIYFPLFIVHHLEGKSSSKKYKQKVEYFKAQDYYYKKWFSPGSYYFLKILRFFYFLKYWIRRG